MPSVWDACVPKRPSARCPQPLNSATTQNTRVLRQNRMCRSKRWPERLRVAFSNSRTDPERRFLTVLLGSLGLAAALSVLGLGLLEHQRLRQDMMSAAGEQIATFVHAQLKTVDTPSGQQLAAPSLEDRAWWKDLAQGLQRDHRVEGLHFLNAAGQVAYAQARSELGTTPLSAEQWAQVLAGHTQELIIPKDVDSTGHVFEAIVPVMYAPAAGSTTRRGAIVIEERAGPFVNELNVVLRLVILGAGVVLVIFMVLLWILGRRLAARSFRDPLTGLPNRRFLDEAGALTLARNERYGRGSALLLADLNRFKEINDSLGHKAGDSVLKAMARVLQQSIRPGDHVARLGGDEFALLLNEADEEQACRVADRIAATLERTVPAEPPRLRISASIGVAASPLHGRTLDELLQNADAAMYRAKRNQVSYAIFDPIDVRATSERLALESDLRDGLDHGDITAYYQPIVNASNGRVVAHEALARWERGDAVISPAKFIPLAESTGLIRRLDRHIFQLAAAKAAKDHATGTRTATTVNVSAQSLSDVDFLPYLRTTIERLGVPAPYLVLEVTETAAVEDLQHARATLQALKDEGFRIALDDFGTGYSSLAYLRSLPIDFVKIDKAFTNGVGTNYADEELIHAVLRYSRALGLKTLAEGVETTQQHQWLRDQGIDYEQGYAHGRPAPLTTNDTANTHAGLTANAAERRAEP